MNVPPGLMVPRAAAVLLVAVGLCKLSSAAAADPINVCVDKDQVLRLVDSGKCPAGQRYLQLALWQPEKPESPTESSTMPAEKPPASSQSGSSGSTVGSSDRKAVPPPASAPPAAGKPAPQKDLHRVTAPFEVVDASGAPIIRVTDRTEGFTRGIYVFDRSGHIVLTLTNGGGGTGGLVRVMKGNDDATRVSMGAYEGALGVFILENDKPRTFMGERDSTGLVETYTSDGNVATQLGSPEGKTPALRILDEKGTQIVAMGMDADGNGVVRAANASGQTGAELRANTNGAGQIGVYFPDGRPAAALFLSKEGAGALGVYGTGGTPQGLLTKGVNGGILQLFDLGGTTMVEAGTSSTGVGVVRTGPMSRGTAAWLGTPGSFIIGKR